MSTCNRGKAALDIAAKADARRKEIVRTLAEWVSIPSTIAPPGGNEAAFQSSLIPLLAELGMEVDSFQPDEVDGLSSHPGYLAGNDYTGRPNVVGRLSGAGRGQSVVFSCHCDVNQPHPLPWRHDPFGPTVEYGRLYGRGALDMKGGAAAAFWAIRLIREAGVTLKGDVLFESIVGEEGGGGVATLAGRLRGHNADLAIVPEPTGMKVCPATLGEAFLRIDVEGEGRQYLAAPGSARTVQIPLAIARIIGLLDDFNKKHVQVRPTSDAVARLYSGFPDPLAIVVEKVKVGDCDVPGALGSATYGWVKVSMRVYPGVGKDTFEEEFFSFFDDAVRKDPLLREARPRVAHETGFLRGALTETYHPAVAMMSREIERVCRGVSSIEGAPFACDAFVFTEYFNTPTIVIGPGGANAHAADEYVEVDDIIELTKAFAAFILDWCEIA